MKNTVVNESDPRVIKTKKQLKDAFKDLILLYDDFMSINVKELCDKAGVSRKTFYLHYKQVDDLLLDVQNEYIEEFYNRTKDFNFYYDIEKVVGVYFDMNEGDPVYKKIATTSVYFFTREISRKKTVEYFIKKGMVFTGEKQTAAIMDFLYFFYDMTVYVMYKRWVMKNYPLPKEQMIVLTANLIRDGIPQLKKD